MQSSSTHNVKYENLTENLKKSATCAAIVGFMILSIGFFGVVLPHQIYSAARHNFETMKLDELQALMLTTTRNNVGSALSTSAILIPDNEDLLRNLLAMRVVKLYYRSVFLPVEFMMIAFEIPENSKKEN